MTHAVSDSRSNANDQIDHAVRVIGRSKDRRAVFEAICFGKQAKRTPEEVAKRSGLTVKRVLEEAVKLASQHIIEKERNGVHVAYRRDPFYSANKKKILRLVDNPAKLAELPTKTRPAGRSKSTIRVELPRARVKVRTVTIDEIDSFKAVKKVGEVDGKPLPEATFKAGVRKTIGEPGTFQDWGGEKNDLFSTRVRYRGKRRACAFAFKGPGTKGKLTPGKMGKNGDQIQRLFQTPADIYLLQYWGQIEDSVSEQMHLLAIATSYRDGREVLYGVIDGRDSNRLASAYAKNFKKGT